MSTLPVLISVTARLRPAQQLSWDVEAGFNMKFHFLRQFAWLFILFVSCLTQGIASERPNLVILFADDAGYADFGFQGGGIDGDFAELTPHIDSLADGGVQFTNGYVSAAVCTPSRAGLLTGRYQHRFGVETVYGRIPEAGLPATEMTMADVLRKAGYRTYALGKWHLGEHLPEHHPNQCGFDEFYGALTGARTFFPYRGNNDASKLQRNGVFLPEPSDQPYFTDLLARQTAAYIDEHVANHTNEPFFIYLAFTAVHTPLEADPKRLADPRIQSITPAQRKTLAAMTIAMDDAVGTVMAKLRENNLTDNTIVVFLSDNGGPEDNRSLRAPNWSDNGVLRGNKSQNFEGGIRVPFVIHWPGGIGTSLRGKALPDVVTALDLLPTFAEAADAALPADREIDGLSLVSRLRGKSSALPERTHFWRQVSQKAVRKGDWKLYQANRSSAPELYHLATDIEETKNLAATEPRKLAELRAAYAEWEKDMIEPLWNYRGMRAASTTTTAPPRRPASNLEATFRRLDRNGDGKVTRQELPRAEIFDRFDRNGDGVIQASEVGARPRPATAPETRGETRGQEPSQRQHCLPRSRVHPRLDSRHSRCRRQVDGRHRNELPGRPRREALRCNRGVECESGGSRLHWPHGPREGRRRRTVEGGLRGRPEQRADRLADFDDDHDRWFRQST